MSRIREFVISNFYVPNPADLDEGASLLDRGIIDSTGVMEVVAFVEDEFGIKVEDEEMIPENLDSIARIAAFVERKKSKSFEVHESTINGST